MRSSGVGEILTQCGEGTFLSPLQIIRFNYVFFPKNNWLPCFPHSVSNGHVSTKIMILSTHPRTLYIPIWPQLLSYPVPWDVAHNFDLIVSSRETFLDENLLYLPGHLCFFRHSQSVVDEFLKYPALKDLETFRSFEHDGKWISPESGPFLSLPRALVLIMIGWFLLHLSLFLL